MAGRFRQCGMALLNLVTLGLLGLFIVRATLDAAQNYLISSAGQRMTANLRTQLFDHLARLPLSYYDLYEQLYNRALTAEAEEVTL